MTQTTEIFINDTLPPEVIATISARYSRSTDSAKDLLNMSVEDARKFMAQYYIGYGHESIGQCGSTTIFIEGISIYAANVLERHGLFNGQESSTRYNDFNKMAPANDVGRQWFELYNRVFTALLSHYETKFPYGESKGVTTVEHTKAIRAKAFDVARGFLPSSTRTNVAWHTTLHTAKKHLEDLSFHPLDEVKQLAVKTYAALQEKYPSSFPGLSNSIPHMGMYDENYWPDCQYDGDDSVWDESDSVWVSYANPGYKDLKHQLSNRPKYAPLPSMFNSLGAFNIVTSVDFAGYRDLRRHRSCYMSGPKFRKGAGILKWYYDQISGIPELSDVYDKAENLIDHTLLAGNIRSNHFTDIEDIGDLPIGLEVWFSMAPGLPSATYIAELRSGKHVHPTVRNVVLSTLVPIIKRIFPTLPIWVDENNYDDTLVVTRGKQDFILK